MPYVAAELAKCNIESTVMEGNLSCSGKTYQNVVDAIVKTFSNLDIGVREHYLSKAILRKISK